MNHIGMMRAFCSPVVHSTNTCRYLGPSARWNMGSKSPSATGAGEEEVGANGSDKSLGSHMHTLPNSRGRERGLMSEMSPPVNSKGLGSMFVKERRLGRVQGSPGAVTA